jgi:hypothetical protein
MKRASCDLQRVSEATSSGTHVQFSKLQLDELRELIHSYGDTPPRWLMHETKMTRPRRKLLMYYLYESGLDGEWCQFYRQGGHSDWCNALHLVYHQLEAGKK